MAGGNFGTKTVAKLKGDILSFPVNASTTDAEGHIYRGSPVVQITSTSGSMTVGFAMAGDGADNISAKFLGIAEQEADSTASAGTGSSNGDLNVKVRRKGIFRMTKNTTSAASDVGKLAFLHTKLTSSVDPLVSLAGVATYDVVCGLIVQRVPDTPGGSAYTNDWLMVDITPAAWVDIDLTAHAATMVSAANGDGAALVGVEDATGYYSGVTVEAVLDEIGADIVTAQAFISIPLQAWHLEDGTILTKHNAAPIPGFIQSGNEDLVMEWATHANPGEIITNVMIPPDLDATADFILHILGMPYGGGAITDSPTFTVQAFQIAVGGAVASDTDFGVTSTEFTAAKTLQEKTSTMLAANVAVAPSVITLIINPTDGELGNDSFYLYGTWIEYTRKILTS